MNGKKQLYDFFPQEEKVYAMFSDYRSHLVMANAYVLLALNWEVPMVTMAMALRNDKLKKNPKEPWLV